MVPEIKGIPESNCRISADCEIADLSFSSSWPACCRSPSKRAITIKFIELYSNSLYDSAFLNNAYIPSLLKKWQQVDMNPEMHSIMKKSYLVQVASNDYLFFIVM